MANNLIQFLRKSRSQKNVLGRRDLFRNAKLFSCFQINSFTICNLFPDCLKNALGVKVIYTLESLNEYFQSSQPNIFHKSILDMRSGQKNLIHWLFSIRYRVKCGFYMQISFSYCHLASDSHKMPIFTIYIFETGQAPKFTSMDYIQVPKC